MKINRIAAMILAAVLFVSLLGCTKIPETETTEAQQTTEAAVTTEKATEAPTETETEAATERKPKR